LILVKLVLEVILVYWMALVWSPKGILEKVRLIFFIFLWVGSKDHFVIPWVKWDILASPKSLGGWGLKNIFYFSKALAAKSVWRLITTDSIWNKVISKKYISPDSMEEWIIRPTKETSNCSIIWKVITNSFQVVGDGLAWHVGKGTQFRVGIDPWPGSGRNHILPQGMLDWLHA